MKMKRPLGEDPNAWAAASASQTPRSAAESVRKKQRTVFAYTSSIPSTQLRREAVIPVSIDLSNNDISDERSFMRALEAELTSATADETRNCAKNISISSRKLQTDDKEIDGGTEGGGEAGTDPDGLSLKLTGNRIDDQGVIAIAQVLPFLPVSTASSPTTLAPIAGSVPSRISPLSPPSYAHSNSPPSAAIPALEDHHCSARKLRSLDLSYNHIGAQGCIAIAPLLTGLHTLNLSHNKIDNDVDTRIEPSMAKETKKKKKKKKKQTFKD